MNNKSMIYIFTGDGKGKTSAALGISVRAICAGLKVAWISWYKNSDWDIAEKNIGKFLPVDYFMFGLGFYINKNNESRIMNHGLKTKRLDKYSRNDHKIEACKAYDKALELLKSGKYDVLILDEINTALADKLLTFPQIKNLLSQKGKTHLILTGRNAPHRLQDLSDLVSEIQNIKHPFDKGINAVKGLDY